MISRIDMQLALDCTEGERCLELEIQFIAGDVMSCGVVAGSVVTPIPVPALQALLGSSLWLRLEMALAFRLQNRAGEAVYEAELDRSFAEAEELEELLADTAPAHSSSRDNRPTAEGT